MGFYAEVKADGHNIRKLRSDGDLEFYNDLVRKFFKILTINNFPPLELLSKMVL